LNEILKEGDRHLKAGDAWDASSTTISSARAGAFLHGAGGV
jgi:hypothetical protein